MVDRIRKIISYNLLCFKLIRPHTDTFIGNKTDLCPCLLNKDLTACNYPLYKAHDIKPLKLYFIRAEFQLIQRQKIFHHHIHFRRFVYDHITVKFAAFGIFADSFFQPFRIPLDKGDRRL